ncbi:hypothetical protein DPV78_003608 [Talaromyces pinophilus]|nr:hypothetical protein DPV78_003608 [Talaromyces pinophilus]
MQHTFNTSALRFLNFVGKKDGEILKLSGDWCQVVHSSSRGMHEFEDLGVGGTGPYGFHGWVEDEKRV